MHFQLGLLNYFHSQENVLSDMHALKVNTTPKKLDENKIALRGHTSSFTLERINISLKELGKELNSKWALRKGEASFGHILSLEAYQFSFSEESPY